MLNKSVRLFLLTFLILIAIMAVVIIKRNATNQNTVSAQELLNEVTRPDSILKLASEDQVIYYETKIYQRTDSSIIDPPDPYHLPVSDFYHAEQLSIHWVTYNGFAQTQVLTTNPELVLTKFVLKPETISYYNAFTNQAQIMPRPATNNNDEPEPVGWIDDVHLSSWGSSAWVIKLEPMPASPTDYDVLPQKLVQQSQPPFAADLDFEQTQWVWEIDQHTDLLVSQSLFALTSPEPTLIYSELRSKPEIVPISQLPSGWDELPVVAKARGDEESGDVPLKDSDAIESAIQLLAFPIFLPQDDALTEFSLASAYVTYESSPGLESSALDFELTDIGTDTLGFKVVYLEEPFLDSNSPRAIVVVQTASNEVLSKLQHSLPLWSESYPINVIIEGQPVEGWLVSGGLLRDSKNPVIGLIVEMDETIIYVEGQNLQEEDIVRLVSQLQRAN